MNTGAPERRAEFINQITQPNGGRAFFSSLSTQFWLSGSHWSGKLLWWNSCCQPKVRAANAATSARLTAVPGGKLPEPLTPFGLTIPNAARKVIAW